MKKLQILAALALAATAFGQVAIGKGSVSTPSVSLEFGNIAGNASTQKGLLLPWVTGRGNVAGVVPGTMVFDSSDKKVYFNKAGNWTDLTLDGTGSVDTSLQTAQTESAVAKVNIGATVENNVPGILVLSDTNKAMVLPLVDKYSSVVSPSPGMMVYDLANNLLCLYNGSVWTFWKP